MDKEKVAPALGKVTSGLYIGSGWVDEVPVGMLCSFVEQAGFDPPMLTVAIGPDRRLAESLDLTKKMVINILGLRNQELMRVFANPNNAQPFDDLRLTKSAHGPRLDDALAYLDCEWRGQIPSGDHVIYLVEVVDGALLDADGEPMTRVRRNGFNY